jgi:hypothetical protein
MFGVRLFWNAEKNSRLPSVEFGTISLSAAIYAQLIITLAMAVSRTLFPSVALCVLLALASATPATPAADHASGCPASVVAGATPFKDWQGSGIPNAKALLTLKGNREHADPVGDAPLAAPPTIPR